MNWNQQKKKPWPQFMFGENLMLIFFFCDKRFVCAAIWMFYISRGYRLNEGAKGKFKCDSRCSVRIVCSRIRISECESCRKEGKNTLRSFCEEFHFGCAISIFCLWIPSKWKYGERCFWMERGRFSLSHVMSGGCNSEGTCQQEHTHKHERCMRRALCAVCRENMRAVCRGRN